MRKLRTSKIRRRRKRDKRYQLVRRQWRGTNIVVIYKGPLDHDKDQAVRKALGQYDTGSGFSFASGERDLTATVPDDDFERVLGELKKIRGIKIKKQVIDWVLCR